MAAWAVASVRGCELCATYRAGDGPVFELTALSIAEAAHQHDLLLLMFYGKDPSECSQTRLALSSLASTAGRLEHALSDPYLDPALISVEKRRAATLATAVDHAHRSLMIGRIDLSVHREAAILLGVHQAELPALRIVRGVPTYAYKIRARSGDFITRTGVAVLDELNVPLTLVKSEKTAAASTADIATSSRELSLGFPRVVATVHSRASLCSLQQVAHAYRKPDEDSGWPAVAFELGAASTVGLDECRLPAFSRPPTSPASPVFPPSPSGAADAADAAGAAGAPPPRPPQSVPDAVPPDAGDGTCTHRWWAFVARLLGGRCQLSPTPTAPERVVLMQARPAAASADVDAPHGDKIPAVAADVTCTAVRHHATSHGVECSRPQVGEGAHALVMPSVRAGQPLHPQRLHAWVHWAALPHVALLDAGGAGGGAGGDRSGGGGGGGGAPLLGSSLLREGDVGLLLAYGQHGAAGAFTRLEQLQRRLLVDHLDGLTLLSVDRTLPRARALVEKIGVVLGSASGAESSAEAAAVAWDAGLEFVIVRIAGSRVAEVRLLHTSATDDALFQFCASFLQERHGGSGGRALALVERAVRMALDTPLAALLVVPLLVFVCRRCCRLTDARRQGGLGAHYKQKTC